MTPRSFRCWQGHLFSAFQFSPFQRVQCPECPAEMMVFAQPIDEDPLAQVATQGGIDARNQIAEGMNHIVMQEDRK